MNKKVIAISCMLGLVAGLSYAGMGYRNGLPEGWNFSTDQGYGTASAVQGINGNTGSAMCVACHSVNPSKHIPTPQGHGSKNAASLKANASYLGSHYVMNIYIAGGTAATQPMGQTDTGGGFLGSIAGPRNGQQYEKLDAWSSLATSKYGNKSATDLKDPAGTPYLSATGGDMICESCHNLTNNVTAYGGTQGTHYAQAALNKLLLEKFEDNGVGSGIGNGVVGDSSKLCYGCHKEMSADDPALNNSNLKPFSTGYTNAKRHHVVTGDKLNIGPGHYTSQGGVYSYMWASSASESWDNGWCATPYAKIDPPATKLAIIAATTDTAGPTIQFRDQCNAAGQGTLAFSATRGDIKPADTNTVNCSNCHRPHNAATGAGAFILRTGTNNGQDFPRKTSNTDATLPGTQGTVTLSAGDGTGGYLSKLDAFGVRRQKDVGGATLDYKDAKIYNEYLTLCQGCHRGYGVVIP